MVCIDTEEGNFVIGRWGKFRQVHIQFDEFIMDSIRDHYEKKFQKLTNIQQAAHGTMKISEFIMQLEKVMGKHGDVEINVDAFSGVCEKEMEA